MRIDRRLMLIGIIIVVLSMTMATQYATTKVTYSFSIVHPSNADIRYIGSDNSSDDGVRVLRVTNNNSEQQTLKIELGDWAPGETKNYTAVFGIVNEEPYPINITFLNMSGTNYTYVSMWLHGDRDLDYTADGAASVKVINAGTALFNENTVVWTMKAGDGNVATMNASAADIPTIWDTTANVQYSISDTNAVNETSDFVWVGISINVPDNALYGAAATGTIYIHLKATTIT